jgi:hypothetical protein
MFAAIRRASSRKELRRLRGHFAAPIKSRAGYHCAPLSSNYLQSPQNVPLRHPQFGVRRDIEGENLHLPGFRIHFDVANDAPMAEAATEDVEAVSAALDRVMRDASAVVLRGYELPTDVQIVRPGGRYQDKRGLSMWATVTRLVARLEQQQEVS